MYNQLFHVPGITQKKLDKAQRLYILRNMQMLIPGICFILHVNEARSPGGLLHFWPQVSQIFFLAAQSFQMQGYSYHSVISKTCLNNFSGIEYKPQLQTDYLNQ